MNKYLCFLAVGAACFRLAAAPLIPASGPAAASASAAGSSFNSILSADGRHLVFISHVNNLVTNSGVSPSLNVFRSTINFPHTIGYPPIGLTNMVLVSVSTNGVGGANADANYPGISSNGQFIAFASRASNLVPGDNNGASDVFVRDVVNGTTRLVSVDVNGSSPADPAPVLNIPLSGNPLISGNGRWIFFESRATNLTVTPAPLGSVNVYARDTWSNVTVLVTATTNAEPLAGSARLASVTSDGTLVAFTTTNRSVVPGITNAGPEAYVRDLAAGVTIWASSNAAARMGGAYTCSDAQLARDSRVVVFNATAKSNGTTAPLIFDLDSATTTRVTTGNPDFSITNSPPIISADGSVVGFQANDYCCVSQILLWDRSSNAPVVVYQSYFWQPVQPLVLAAISPDGEYVAFFDRSYPIATNGTPRAHQLFMKEMTSGTLRLISAKTNGEASSVSHEFSTVAIEQPWIASSSAFSLVLAFDSTAGDLIEDDRNGASDVFLRAPLWDKSYLVSAAHAQRPTATALSLARVWPNSISGDGRYVVFTRYDDPSAFRDTNGWSDVFLADLLTGTTRSLSLDTVLHTNNGGTIGDPYYVENTNWFSHPIISENGSAFAAIRQGPFFTAPGPGQIALAGPFRNYSGQPPNAPFNSPSLSADGDLLAFQSAASDFVDYDYNNVLDVFVRYRPGVTNQMYPWIVTSLFLVSRSTNGYQSGSALSTNPVVSPDGRWIAFQTLASDIVASAAPADLAFPSQPSWPYSALQLVVAELGTNRYGTNYLTRITNRLCSYTIVTNGYPEPGYPNTVLQPSSNSVVNAFWSRDSRYVFFSLTNPVATYRHDLFAGRTNWYYRRFDSNGHPAFQFTNTVVAGVPNVLVCTNCQNLSVNADGNTVAFERLRAGSSITDLFIKDLAPGEEFLITALNGSSPNGASLLPQIGGAGRYVVFQSQANNLIAHDTNGMTDIFVRDRLLGVTLLVSGNALGLPGNGPSTRPVMAADGRTVVFQSFASDLVSADYNEKRDLFVLKLGSADTDGDQIDDDWEVAHFENLSRDGDGDFDGDGSSDRAEFLAGTDPKNDGSVFRVLAVSPAGGGSKQLIWSGNPARSYRVEFKDDLNANGWTPVNGTISWNGTVAFIIDGTASNSPQRIYRAVRLP